MKFAVLAFAALASVASAQTTKVCNTIGLLQVVGGKNGLKCAEDSGYSATSGQFPTPQQFSVLCFNDACAAYRQELKDKEPEECIIKDVLGPDTPLYGKLITPIEEECKKYRTPAPTPSNPGQTPTVTPKPAC